MATHEAVFAWILQPLANAGLHRAFVQAFDEVNELDVRFYIRSARGQVVRLECLGSHRVTKLLTEALFEEPREDATHRFH